MNSNIINFFVNNKLNSKIILPILLLFHLFNCFLERKYNKKKKTIFSLTFKETKDTLFVVVLILFVLTLILNIPILKNVLYMINTLYLSNKFIFNPLFNHKLDFDYNKDNLLISGILLSEISYYLIVFKYENIIKFFDNQLLIQFSVIISIFIIIFLIIYMILINSSFIIYYLDSLYINNFSIKIDSILSKIKSKYDLNLYEKEIQKEYAWNEIISFLKLLLKLIKTILISFCIAIPLLMINGFFKIINKHSNITDNSIYSISKISLVISLIIVYVIIEITGEFSNSLVSIYELITSTLIIPLVLEKLLKNKKDN